MKYKVTNNVEMLNEEFNLEEYNKKFNSKAVKKTLSIPQWLNEEAMAKNINFYISIAGSI